MRRADGHEACERALAAPVARGKAPVAVTDGNRGLGRGRHLGVELSRLRVEVAQLREEREKALSIANTADSLLKTEKAAQDKLAQQIKQIEDENLALKNDLGFFERLLPAGDSVGVTIRGLQAEIVTAGQLRYQLLVMQPGKAVPEINGRYEMTLSGALDGQPWSQPQPGGSKPLQLKQYLRVEGLVEYPVQAVVNAVSVKVTDARGGVLATYSVKI